MKKQLTVALGLAVLATPAFATKARLEALGEDNFGSYYINDNRNIFLNAAKINENKDFVTYEFGAALNNRSNAAVADTVAAPRAEGGFAKSAGKFVYGAHVGATTPTTALFRNEVTGGQEKNPIDIFFGGDMGLKWGVNVGYENYDGSVDNEATGTGTSSDNRISSNALRTRVGVISGDTEAFALVSLKGDAHNRMDETQMEGKSSWQVGVGHWFNNYKLFVENTTAKAEYGTGNTDNDIELAQWRLGVARAEKLNDKATLFAKAMVVQRELTDKFTAGKDEVKTTTLPLNLGVEYDALSWLQVRASVGHNLWGSEERKYDGEAKIKSSVASTAVRAGASLKFGDFQIDGLISTTNDGNVDSAAATATQTDTTRGRGNLRTDSLMTRVGMVYRF